MKYFFVFAICCLFVSSSQGQFYIGGGFGISKSNIVHTEIPKGPTLLRYTEEYSKAKLTFGIYGLRKLSSKWNVKLDFQYVYRGSETNSNDFIGDDADLSEIGIKHLDATAAVEFTPSKFLFTELGFYNGIGIQTFSDSPPWGSSKYRGGASDRGIILGGGFELKNIRLRYRYSHGLKYIFQKDRTRLYIIDLGYLVKIK